MKQKSCLSEKFNKLINQAKKKNGNTNIIRNQRATDIMDIKRITKACYK